MSAGAISLGDRERTQLQETGELTIDPRVPIHEIVDLLSDLGLILGDDAHLVEAGTVYGIGLRLSTGPSSTWLADAEPSVQELVVGLARPRGQLEGAVAALEILSEPPDCHRLIALLLEVVGELRSLQRLPEPPKGGER